MSSSIKINGTEIKSIEDFLKLSHSNVHRRFDLCEDDQKLILEIAYVKKIKRVHKDTKLEVELYSETPIKYEEVDIIETNLSIHILEIIKYTDYGNVLISLTIMKK